MVHCNHKENDWIKRVSDPSYFVSQLNGSGLTWERGKAKLCVRNENLKSSHLQASHHLGKKPWKSTDQSLRLHEMMVFSLLVFLFFTTSAFFPPQSVLLQTGPELNTSPLLSILCYYLTELNPQPQPVLLF